MAPTHTEKPLEHANYATRLKRPFQSQWNHENWIHMSFSLKF